MKWIIYAIICLSVLAVILVAIKPQNDWKPLPNSFNFSCSKPDSIPTIRLSQLTIMDNDSIMAIGQSYPPSGKTQFMFCYAPDSAKARKIVAAFPQFAGQDEQKFLYVANVNQIKLEIILEFPVFLLREEGKNDIRDMIYLDLPARIYQKRH